MQDPAILFYGPENSYFLLFHLFLLFFVFIQFIFLVSLQYYVHFNSQMSIVYENILFGQTSTGKAIETPVVLLEGFIDSDTRGYNFLQTYPFELKFCSNLERWLMSLSSKFQSDWYIVYLTPSEIARDVEVKNLILKVSRFQKMDLV